MMIKIVTQNSVYIIDDENNFFGRNSLIGAKVYRYCFIKEKHWMYACSLMCKNVEIIKRNWDKLNQLMDECSVADFKGNFLLVLLERESAEKIMRIGMVTSKIVNVEFT